MNYSFPAYPPLNQCCPVFFSSSPPACRLESFEFEKILFRSFSDSWFDPVASSNFLIPVTPVWQVTQPSF